MKKTTIYIPDELALSVKAAARQKSTSEASLIREAIAVYITELDRPMPDFIGSVAIEGVHGRDSEEWLLENWQHE